MSVYDTREIGKVKICMLKGQDGAGAYSAGDGIDLTNNVISNTMPGYACNGAGKMTSYTNEVVDTDIDLHRAPVIGDRILLYCNSAVSNPSSIKTYNNGTAVSNATGPFSPINYVKGFNVLEFRSNVPFPNCWALVQAVQTGMPESPLAINHGGTGNTVGYIQTGKESGSTVGSYATIEGAGNTASNDYAHAEGYQNEASGSSSHAEGWATTASGSNTHAEGSQTIAEGDGSHAEGLDCYAEGDYSHAEGVGCIAEGDSSHAEGSGNTASGIASHAEGGFFNSGDNNVASGNSAHAEGAKNTASGAMAHAEGYNTTASAGQAHAEGSGTQATQANTHAEGYNTTASNYCAHAGGTTSVASGLHSFAHGQYVNAGYAQQSVLGRYNDNKAANLFEIGNGTADNARSNAMEVTANGHVLDGNGNDLQSVAALEQSASGNPIIINAQGIAAKELSVELEPIQDLHGYSYPWAGGAGKNKYPILISADSFSNQGGGTHSGSDGVLTVNVSAVDDGVYSQTTSELNKVFDDMPIGNVTYSFYMKASVAGNVAIGYLGKGNTWINATTSWVRYNITYDKAESGSANFIIYNKVAGARTIEIKDFMIEVGNSMSAYESYSNICPISGRTGTTVSTRNADNTETASATISFGQTVYGAKINFKTGEGTITHVRETFDGSTEWPEPNDRGSFAKQLLTYDAKSHAESATFEGISNYLPASSGNGIYNGAVGVNCNNKWLGLRIAGVTTKAQLTSFTTANPLQVCYPLATPIELTLTPSMLELLEGLNYITGDGEMALIYIPESVLGMPIPPTADGNYKLCCTVSGGVPSFSWVSDT